MSVSMPYDDIHTLLVLSVITLSSNDLVLLYGENTVIYI